MPPLFIVRSSLPPHFVHLPTRGTRRYFALHPTQRNTWLENERRFPYKSGKKCERSILSATSFASTHRSAFSSSSCAATFSPMSVNCTYAVIGGPSFMSSVSCVNIIPEYCAPVPSTSFTLFIFTSEVLAYLLAAS